jgi:hypothetical protein
MAFVRSIFSRPQERTGVHPTTVDCGYTVVITDGGPILQITTYGSQGRQIPGKASQTLQFDARSARELGLIINTVFRDTATKESAT